MQINVYKMWEIYGAISIDTKGTNIYFIKNQTAWSPIAMPTTPGYKKSFHDCHAIILFHLHLLIN